MEVEWRKLKAQDLRALAAENAVVVIPVASIEQHGPHLPVETDTRLGHEIAVRAARKASATRPTIVTPVVWMGLSEHHMPFGGTLTVSHSTFRAILRDLIVAVTRHGFRDVLISNSHGGNIIAMQQIADELASQVDATIVATTYVMEAGETYGEIMEDQASIQHACEGETSMMLAVAPDLVDASDLGTPFLTPVTIAVEFRTRRKVRVIWPARCRDRAMFNRCVQRIDYADRWIA